MKKLIFPLVLIATFAFFSFKDYGTCPGTAGYKALTCGSCHGGSVSDNVFILDGKVEEGVDDDNNPTIIYTGNIVVKDLSDLLNLQIAVRPTSNTIDTRNVALGYVTPLIKGKDLTVSKPLTISLEKSKKSMEIPIAITVDGSHQESSGYQVEIVMSNGDGSPNGDYVVSKEIKIEPLAKNEENIMPGCCQIAEESFYSQQKIFVSSYSLEPIQVLVYDMQGRLQVQQNFQYTTQIDVSNLPDGMYFVKQIQLGQDDLAFTFVK